MVSSEIVEISTISSVLAFTLCMGANWIMDDGTWWLGFEPWKRDALNATGGSMSTVLHFNTSDMSTAALDALHMMNVTPSMDPLNSSAVFTTRNGTEMLGLVTGWPPARNGADDVLKGDVSVHVPGLDAPALGHWIGVHPQAAPAVHGAFDDVFRAVDTVRSDRQKYGVAALLDILGALP